ncbi:MAG TPA: hypothetical protein VH396_02820, partial [Chitinophagaceae bacterium]
MILAGKLKMVSGFLLFTLIAAHSNGSAIRISNFAFSGNMRDSVKSLFVYFTVSWDNAWRNDKNYDAAWVFFKLRHQDDSRSHKPVQVKLAGHKMLYNYLNNVNPDFYVPAHQGGLLIYLSKQYRGNVSWRVKVDFDVSKLTSIDFSNNVVFGDVFAIEMVQIPGGQFYIGDEDPIKQRKESSLFDAATKGKFLVNSERSISIGDNRGSVNYFNNDLPQFRGDMTGTVPDSFPKGFKQFFVMKYEVKQGEYTAFLNTLSNQS